MLSVAIFGVLAYAVLPFGNSQAATADPYYQFEQPTQIVSLENGAQLALYCSGRGSPTVILESGAGGRTYESWYRLQPLVAEQTRVCSYDRAGFGFSRLGHDLPRDLNHDIADLHDLLPGAGERGPYVLIGHSMGGTLVGAYADKYPDQVAGMVLLEPAVVLSADEVSETESAEGHKHRRSLEQDLQKFKRCAARMDALHAAPQPKPKDDCLDTNYFNSLPPAMANVELKHESRPEYWWALESELRNNWLGVDARQAARFMPHRWRSIPIRVITAAVSEAGDKELAQTTGIPIADKVSLGAVRKNHARSERRQARVCEFSSDCKVTTIRTAEHFVQNADPDKVAHVVQELTTVIRKERMNAITPADSIHDKR